MSALRIFTHFMQLRKLGLFFKTSISLKPEFLTNVPQAKCFIIGLIIHLKTLPKCQKRKEFKNRFSRPKRLNQSKLWPTGSTGRPVVLVQSRTGRGRPKSFSLTQSPSFPGRGDSLPSLGPIEDRSRSSREPIEVRSRQQ